MPLSKFIISYTKHQSLLLHIPKFHDQFASNINMNTISKNFDGKHHVKLYL